MKILVIEDEKHNAARIQRIVEEINPSYQTVAVLQTVSASVEWLNAHAAPDVILMDVRLADGLCFEIFEQTSVSSPVIFTTAYDEYAVRAFKVSGIDYLLKPIEKQELIVALLKVKPVSAGFQPDAGLTELLKVFIERNTVYRRRFLIPSFDGYKAIAVEEIDLVYSEFKVTHITLKNGSVEIVSQSLEDLEDELDPETFFRANRQIIVNVNCIKSIQNELNGKLRIILKRDFDTEILVSREKAPVFKAWLDR
ncbi:LytR/AlgR family response regulator transcription factor [Dyadobacter sp. 32]|uniref:LytR/AlgR family response regulator transcription factor n=1 Tax=Dyadobacter sp. 32 TaxID=538966 RepID=UPI0011EF8958